MRGGQAALRWSLAAALLAVGLLQASTWLSLLHFVGTQWTPGGYGTPLRYTADAAQHARALRTPVIALTPGDDPRTADLPAAFDYLLRNTQHRLVDGSRLAVLPEQPSSVIVAPGADAARNVYSYDGWLENARTLPGRQGEDPFLVASVGGPQAPVAQYGQSTHRWANGLQLVGYRIAGFTEAPRALTWWVAYRVGLPPEDLAPRYHVFNHVVDGVSRMLAQADGPLPRTTDWRQGDTFVLSFLVSIPEDVDTGDSWMRMGMYSYPDLRVVPRLDQGASPTGAALVVCLCEDQWIQRGYLRRIGHPGWPTLPRRGRCAASL